MASLRLAMALCAGLGRCIPSAKGTPPNGKPAGRSRRNLDWAAAVATASPGRSRLVPNEKKENDEMDIAEAFIDSVVGWIQSLPELICRLLGG